MTLTKNIFKIKRSLTEINWFAFRSKLKNAAIKATNTKWSDTKLLDAEQMLQILGHNSEVANLGDSLHAWANKCVIKSEKSSANLTVFNSFVCR